MASNLGLGRRTVRKLGSEVYEHVRDMILSHELRPGQKVLDRKLAERLGVSRTPVREALTRLEQIGLISRAGGNGYVVVEMEAKQVDDLYDLRELLEVHAIRLAVQRAGQAEVDALATVLTTLESYRSAPEKRSEEVLVGLQIHEIVARASGNPFLHETLTRLLERMRTFVWVESVSADDAAAERTREEHRAFLTVIREKRIDEAEALVRRHIRAARAHIVRILSARERFYQTMQGVALSGPQLGPPVVG